VGLAAIFKQKLGVLFDVREAAELELLRGLPKSPKPERLMIALQLFGDAGPDEAQDLARQVRAKLKKLGCEDSRVLAAIHEPCDTAILYYLKPDLDGVLLLDSNYGEVVQLAETVMLYG
jgi:hypothetical protein